MPGPNSAPNGDSVLVVGYGNDKIVIKVNDKDVEVIAREHFAKRGRLYTGKTENK